MSNNMKTYTGHGFLDDHEEVRILVDLSVEEIKKDQQTATGIFAANPNIMKIVFRASDPIEIEMDEESEDSESYVLAPAPEKHVRTTNQFSMRYANMSFHRFGQIYYRTRPKHWDAVLALDVRKILE